MSIYDKKNIRKFLLLAFVIGWALQLMSLAGVRMGGTAGQLVYTSCNALCMLAPGFAVLFTCGGLRGEKTGIQWKLKSKQVLVGLVAAIVIPAALVLAGAGFYFFLFPGKFSTDNQLYQMLTSASAQTGLSLGAFLAVYYVGGAVSGGCVNMLFALGEEIGWTGYLVPALSSHVGERKAVLLRGIIWGAWHWPLILLAGYEYGTGYWGAPFTGLLMMLVFTTGMGVIMVRLYKYCESIWIPALGHGVLNAVAAFPLAFLAEGTAGYLFGPTIAGGTAGIPMLLLAVVLFRQFEK